MNQTNPEDKQEFHVKIRRTGHGYVRVMARSKDEAKSVVETMNHKRLMGFYKEKFAFINVDEAITPEDD